MTKNPTPENPTACVLIIGNEVLSGRTQDVNLNFLAKKLSSRGILLREARVIPDIPDVIISAVNECRAKFSYVFTTGGIGPTHDDITSECVAAAFGVLWVVHPEARERLLAYYRAHHAQGEAALNDARLRMATVPEGATLIDNPLTTAPGFRMENVFVMAGIPKVMQAMVDTFIDTLAHGNPVVMKGLTCEVAEGDLAASLKDVQKHFPNVDIGSYPMLKTETSRYVTQLICKGTNEAIVDAALAEIEAFLTAMDKPYKKLGEIL